MPHAAVNSAAELGENARRVLAARYLRLDASGAVAETPEEMFQRVARAVAEAELAHGPAAVARQWEERFHALMAALDFLPNSPTLMNAGTRLGQLSACFVLPVEDQLTAIFDAVKNMALVQRSGGGTGFSFSRLRGQGERLSSSGGRSSGPVSFMKIFDAATENVKLGGRRRGANMAVLRADHPDIEEFIECKRQEGVLGNFNLSVAAPDRFMAAVAAGADWVTAADGQVRRRLPARGLFERLRAAAWATGDPGMLFVDAVNRANPVPEAGAIESTNPCGEVPLLPYEACNLGSLNLPRFLVGETVPAEMDWKRLGQAVREAIRFLDDVITVNRYPLPEIEEAALARRKVGLGVMGFAETLILRGLPYDSDDALAFAAQLMSFIAGEAKQASAALAAARGPFPSWRRSRLFPGPPLRNATQVSIAPTGSISLIAGTSPGIEPLFALAYRRRNVLGGQTLTEINPLFARYAERHAPRAARWLEAVARDGRLPRDAAPEWRRLFATALEISPERHVRMQAAFQAHVDNAVSKTVNLPLEASVEQVAVAYRLAHQLGCKGVTVYRYGSKARPMLELGAGEEAFEREYFTRCDPAACKL